MADERLATPLTLGPWALPPCDQPMPFEKDDRLVWTLRCAVQKELGPGRDQRLTKLVADVEAWTVMERAEYAAGVASGLAGGVRDNVTHAAEDLSRIVGGVVKSFGSGVSTMLDPQVWEDIRVAMNAAPDSAESRRAIEEIRKFVGAEHADFMEAIVMASMVLAALRGLLRWAETDQNAAYTVLAGLAGYVGKLIGEIASALAQATIPYDVGYVIGDLCGTLLVETARFYFGV